MKWLPLVDVAVPVPVAGCPNGGVFGFGSLKLVKMACGVSACPLPELACDCIRNRNITKTKKKKLRIRMTPE